jgi:peptide/nickel transport system permease protein
MSRGAVIAREPRILGGIIIMAILISLSTVMIFGGLLDPFKTMASKPLTPPSLEHPLGTDALGRDLLARALLGVLISLYISVLGTLIAFLIGMPIGLISGFYRGTSLDEAIMRVIDALLSFPTLVLVLFISSTYGQGPLIASIAIGIAESPIVARLVRGAVIGIMSSQFIEAVRAIGASRLWIMQKHLIPHSASILITQFTLTLSTAIILESGLSFLGLSTSPPLLSLGGIVREGFLYLDNAWWYAAAPSAFLVAIILSINLIGDGLNDIADPRFRVLRENNRIAFLR